MTDPIIPVDTDLPRIGLEEVELAATTHEDLVRRVLAAYPPTEQDAGLVAPADMLAASNIDSRPVSLFAGHVIPSILANANMLAEDTPHTAARMAASFAFAGGFNLGALAAAHAHEARPTAHQTPSADAAPQRVTMTDNELAAAFDAAAAAHHKVRDRDPAIDHGDGARTIGDVERIARAAGLAAFRDATGIRAPR